MASRSPCVTLALLELDEAHCIAFAFDPANNRAVLNIDKSLLKNAPGFDKDNWPNLSDPSFGQDISKYYGYDHAAGYDEVANATTRIRL